MSGAFPESRVSLITLGVRDRALLTQFYEDVLGFKHVGSPGLTLFDLGGIGLALWERDKLADDAGLPDGPAAPGAFKGVTLAYNARSEQEVDRIFADLDRAGARITKPPHATAWGGYSGYFGDPEGNAWEVAYNPFWPVAADGRLDLPKAPS